jgi:hypothetical protein
MYKCWVFEGTMTGLVQRWRAAVALVAIYALALQALLHSLAPLANMAIDQSDSLFVVLCPPSGHSPNQDKVPGVPADRADTACCILCLVAGLDVANAGGRVARPDYHSSRSFSMTVWIDAGPIIATELSPIRPRAPPRLS